RPTRSSPATASWSPPTSWRTPAVWWCPTSNGCSPARPSGGASTRSKPVWPSGWTWRGRASRTTPPSSTYRCARRPPPWPSNASRRRTCSAASTRKPKPLPSTTTLQGRTMIPTSVTATIAALDAPNGQHIAGAGRPGVDGRVYDVNDPATGALLSQVSDGGPADATAAVDAAAKAFETWRHTAPRVRGEALRKAWELMTARSEELAGLISAENGKALPDARAEVAYAAEFFRWFSEEAVRPEGSYGESPAGGTRTIVTEHPVGVAALVTPWNFPAAMATRKIGPALAAGCTVVLKPAA